MDIVVVRKPINYCNIIAQDVNLVSQIEDDAGELTWVLTGAKALAEPIREARVISLFILIDRFEDYEYETLHSFSFLRHLSAYVARYLETERHILALFQRSCRALLHSQ